MRRHSKGNSLGSGSVLFFCAQGHKLALLLYLEGLKKCFAYLAPLSKVKGKESNHLKTNKSMYSSLT